MEDLIQVVFFLVVILASVFDAVARKRKRPGEPEPEGGEEWGAPEESSRMETRTPAGGVGTGRSGGVEVPGAELPRRTADSMVPPDLWAILTGQPLPQPPEPAPEPGSATGSGAAPVTWEERGTREDVPETGWEVWEEGEAREAKGAATSEIRWEDAVREPVRGESVPFERSTAARPIPVRRGTESAPRRPVAPVGAPVGRLAAAARGAAAAGSGVATTSLEGLGLGARRPRRTLAELGTPRELRRAVILTEVLGTPLALRPRSEPWEER